MIFLVFELHVYTFMAIHALEQEIYRPCFGIHEPCKSLLKVPEIFIHSENNLWSYFK